MTAVISSKTSSGATRRCDARCYDAKAMRCECICGGRNHGVGFEQAVSNNREFVFRELETDKVTSPVEAMTPMF